MSKFTFSFPTTEMSLRVADDVFGIIIDAQNLDRMDRHRLKVIVSELFVNAYLHGNRADPEKYIDVVLEVSGDEFVAIVKDSGNGLSKEKVKALSHTVVDPKSEHGRGLGIMHRLGDRVDSFRDSDGRFCVRVAKKIREINNKNSLVGSNESSQGQA
jgi:anti-sigma regulatory factor (Ser/Thr protein kinase)